MTWPCAQGHALLTRQMGSSLPCPAIDFTGGFNKFYAAAFGLAHTSTAIKEKYGVEFDPFLNDETFVTSVLALEELGATGNKVGARPNHLKCSKASYPIAFTRSTHLTYQPFSILFGKAVRYWHQAFVAVTGCATVHC